MVSFNFRATENSPRTLSLYPGKALARSRRKVHLLGHGRCERCTYIISSLTQFGEVVPGALAPVNAKLLNQAAVWPAPGTNPLRSLFPTTRAPTTLAFHFCCGEFVYPCEDGPRAGLVTNGVGIPSHPELVRREQQLA